MKVKNFIVVGGDTDSIAFKKPDGSVWSSEERASILSELNSYMPEHIVWKDDQAYRRFIVFKAKNYVLDDSKKVKLKGNALKATKKEPALREFIRHVIDLLLKDKKEQAIFAYFLKALEIHNLTDITPWCFKATVTKAVMSSEATVFNQKIRAAIGSTPVSEGDKVYLFYKDDGTLCLREQFNGEYSRERLLAKLFDTLKVFAPVMDVDLFPDLTLTRNRDVLVSMGLRLPEPPKEKAPKPRKVQSTTDGDTTPMPPAPPVVKQSTIVPLSGVKVIRI